MSVIVRGIKNTSRNWIRSGAVVFILAIGIGLALSMLVANQAVNNKINDLKTSMGTTLTINPAGVRGDEGGGEPLTAADAETVKNVAHVSSVDSMIRMVLQNQDSDTNAVIRMRGGAGPGKTNLQSAIEPGTLGKRSQSLNAMDENGAPVSLPISGMGISGNRDESGKEVNITSGTKLPNSDENVAIVGKELAAKNNLSVGSTFTAYDTTIKVVGIFDQGTKFENAGFAMPIATAQRLTGLNEVSAIVATVDSIDNLGSTQTAIKDKLGADKADVVSTQENVQTAISSLESVKTVSIIGFVAAVIAAGVITFLIMLVIVRERRREIGVLKAIGGANRTIVLQFMVEGLVLVAFGALVGTGFALVSSNGIANALVASNTTSSAAPSDNPTANFGRGGGPRRISFGGPNTVEATSNLVKNVTTQIGVTTLLYGLLAAFVIGIVGSAIPAWFIAKIRPAEVMRGE